MPKVLFESLFSDGFFDETQRSPEMMIERPGFIRVKYTGLDSKENELAATKDYAALLAHEIDHLNGILYIDHEHAGYHT